MAILENSWIDGARTPDAAAGRVIERHPKADVTVYVTRTQQALDVALYGAAGASLCVAVAAGVALVRIRRRDG